MGQCFGGNAKLVFGLLLRFLSEIPQYCFTETPLRRSTALMNNRHEVSHGLLGKTPRIIRF